MTLSENNLSSNAVLRRVLRHLQQEHALSLAALSPDLVVQEASERFSEFQGDPSREPVGAPVTELIWELVGSEASLDEVLRGRESLFSLEDINRETPQGGIRYLSIKAIPSVEAVPAAGLLLIIEDTTPASMLEQELVQDRNELRLTRRQLSLANEELRRLDQMKSLFLSIAAHDMRSPLTAMRGYTDLAMKSLPQETRPEVSEYLSIVESLVDAMNRLIADFLDLNTIEQGNLKIRPEACHLNPVVLHVAEVMRAVAGRKNVQIETTLQEDLPPVYADPERIQQILFNLVGNAVKYTGERDTVIVETSLGEGFAQFSVTDHGPGIPEAEVPRLFDLYHRTEEARQSKTKGLGLGLFIVKSLVDLHGGQILTSSEPGRGTQFTVRLPVYQAEFGGEL